MNETERQIVAWLRKQGSWEMESPTYWAGCIERGEHKRIGTKND